MINSVPTPSLLPVLPVAYRVVPTTPLSRLAKRTGGVVLPMNKVLAFKQRNPWNESTERARQTALSREMVVLHVLQQAKTGSLSAAIKHLLSGALDGAPLHVVQALAASAKAGRSCPARSAVFDWVGAYKEGGLNALLPNHKGRQVEMPIWYGSALEYFNQPSKPDMSSVHRLLAQDGFVCTYEQVRDYLKGVPAMYGVASPARLGKNLYRLTHAQYIRRCTHNALPGDVYVADGYRADVYLAHPVTGKIFRPELTVIMDWRSRVIVGWRADEHEGTIAVQSTWAEAITRHNHVPAIVYVDNGSGYKNKLMSDAAIGFYNRAGIAEVIHAIPGNPYGKGVIERFFRTMQQDFLKNWRPDCYCGHDMAGEILNLTIKEQRAGRLILPSLAQFTEAFNAWLDHYAQRPHPEDKRVSKLSIWRELIPSPPQGGLGELKRQSTRLTVRKGSVRHGKRDYTHDDLSAFNGQEVVLEYDLMDDRVAVIRTEQGRWVCDAHLITAMDLIAPNRLDEARQKRARASVHRLEGKKQEQIARAGMVLDAAALAGAALEMAQDIQIFDSVTHTTEPSLLPATKPRTPPVLNLDFC